jgi:magnesium-transporting ATPase (P-type)
MFNRRMIGRVAMSSLYMGVVAFALFYCAQHLGYAVEEARNLTLLLMVMFENILLLGARSEHRSVFRLPLLSNPYLLLSLIGAHTLHLAAIYTPVLNEMLGVLPFSLYEWSVVAALALSLLLVDALYKNLPEWSKHA